MLQKRLKSHHPQPIIPNTEPTKTNAIQKEREPSFTELVTSSNNSGESKTYLWQSLLNVQSEANFVPDVEFTSPASNPV